LDFLNTPPAIWTILLIGKINKCLIWKQFLDGGQDRKPSDPGVKNTDRLIIHIEELARTAALKSGMMKCTRGGIRTHDRRFMNPVL
jgi:hypothetical protein